MNSENTTLDECIIDERGHPNDKDHTYILLGVLLRCLYSISVVPCCSFRKPVLNDPRKCKDIRCTAIG